MFQVARLIVEQLTSYQQDGSDQRRRVLRLQSRHQLFPQVYHYVEAYVQRKVNFQGCHRCELGLQKYVAAPRRAIKRAGLCQMTVPANRPYFRC